MSVVADHTSTTVVAVIGTGSVGTRHLRVLEQEPAIRPVAVPTRQERLKELSGQGMRTAHDIHEAIQAGATIAIIATDTGRHLTDAVSVMERGLDVLVEKPLARDAREACELLKHAKAHKRQLFTGCVMRFSESLTTFREHLPEVGRLHGVTIECQSYLPEWRPDRSYQQGYAARRDEGGVLRDLIHEIDFAGWIYGWPSAVQGRIRNLGRLGIEADERAEVWWEMPDGNAVSVSLDYLSRPSRRRMRARGDRGVIEWDGVTGTVRLAVDGTDVTSWAASQQRDEMFAAQTRALIDAHHGTHDPRLATGEEGVNALAVCDAARRASDARREMPVEYLSNDERRTAIDES